MFIKRLLLSLSAILLLASFAGNMAIKKSSEDRFHEGLNQGGNLMAEFSGVSFTTISGKENPEQSGGYGIPNGLPEADATALGLNQKKVFASLYTPFPPMTNKTASGKEIDTLNAVGHRWIAVSRDLQQEGYTFGTKVHISGTGRHDGVWTVEDVMNKRFSRRIDILTDKSDTLGFWRDITITKLN